MAMSKCKECNKAVSTLAKTCPHCGVPKPTKKTAKKTKKKLKITKKLIFKIIMLTVQIVGLNYHQDLHAAIQTVVWRKKQKKEKL